ncbi:unnamed protein product, partial [Rotaria magnacalcarata]
VNRILIDIHAEKLSSGKSNDIDIVLDFCSSFRQKNYNQLSIIFTLTLSIDIDSTMLAYNSNDICKQRLTSLDKFELELNSTEKERIFHCSSPVELHKQRAKLTVSIEKPIVTPPAFQLQTEQVNSTTIRIHVIPNGYIGVNRIHCHWDDKENYAQVVDLIIGGNFYLLLSALC